MVDINVYGMLAGLHTAFPYLRATPGAQVVNLCSASAIYGQPELATLLGHQVRRTGLTEALELEWRRYGIRVLAMWPLFVKTAMVDGLETAAPNPWGAPDRRRRGPGHLRSHPPGPDPVAESPLPGRPPDEGGRRPGPSDAEFRAAAAQQNRHPALTSVGGDCSEFRPPARDPPRLLVLHK